MTKLEITIRGLECCIKRDPEDDLRCDACPYPAGSACANRLKIDALELLKKQKPVVLCKDCKWFRDSNGIDGFCYCDRIYRRCGTHWFCADGERKEDDEQQT